MQEGNASALVSCTWPSALELPPPPLPPPRLGAAASPAFNRVSVAATAGDAGSATARVAGTVEPGGA